MGIFSRFRKPRGGDAARLAPADYWRAWELSWQAHQWVMGRSEAELWRTQPHLRTVVTFLARNMAQLGLHVYQRRSETDRQRLRDSTLSRVLARPNATTTTYELVYSLIADLALYDHAYWLLGSQDQSIVRLPPKWLTPVGGDALGPRSYDVLSDDRGNSVRIDARFILPFHGWHPESLQIGSSPVAALRSTLAEQIQAAEYRRQIWERGGRVGSVLSRPANAPTWSDQARSQFKADWESNFTGSGPKAGGTPLLEDGMTLNRVDFSAHEQQYVEGAQLAFETVAQVYHVNPTMLGSSSQATYSNVREFRKMLYGDTLGPILQQIQDRLNTFLVPIFDGRDGVYVEFNIAEKLRGNFEEQTQALQSAVGRPWMSADEARARFNMPSVGGDAERLVVPLNVLTGGQASPRDAGKHGASGVRTKGRAGSTHEDKYEQVLAAFFERQRKEVVPKLRSKQGQNPDWWDQDRWDRELTEQLTALGIQTSRDVAHEVLRRSAFEPDSYDVSRTESFIASVASRIASQMNSTTLGQIEQALESAEPDTELENVFDIATESRARQAAATAVTTMSAFGTAEAATQAGGPGSTKTWIVTSNNPRATHAAMNGETVSIDEKFSNGAQWPGDIALSVDEVAGCRCEVEVNFG